MRICERTLEAFNDIGNSSLKNMPIICMKNHTLNKYGIIHRITIEEKALVINDRETHETYEFDSPQALVEAGWIVD